MHPTSIALSREFPVHTGFVEELRRMQQLPGNVEMLELFRRYAPKEIAAKLNLSPKLYNPPRWMGYWISGGVAFGSDGYIKLTIPKREVFSKVIAAIRDHHYAGGGRMPFVELSNKLPSHMLLHDSLAEAVFVSAFEQGEAILVRQPRP